MNYQIRVTQDPISTGDWLWGLYQSNGDGWTRVYRDGSEQFGIETSPQAAFRMAHAAYVVITGDVVAG